MFAYQQIVVAAVACSAALGLSLPGSAPETAQQGAGVTSASEQCTDNTSASGEYYHIKCSSLPAPYTRYRADALCTDGRTAYGVITSPPESVYIGSVADCGRAKVRAGFVDLYR